MNPVRTALLLMLGFVVLAALRGGAALLAVRDEMTIQWLGGDPTLIFALPAVVLFSMGGASLVALIALITKSARRSMATLVPGVLLAGYIALEGLIFRLDAHLPVPIGIVYFLLGCALVALAVLHRRRSGPIRSVPT